MDIGQQAIIAHFQEQLAASQAREQQLREALRFYADSKHFIIVDSNAWDTVSGEPQNLWEDDQNTATVEDGTIAKQALSAPHDTTALDRACKLYAAEVLDELLSKCAKYVMAPNVMINLRSRAEQLRKELE